MYSVVLMMALSGGAEAPEFGRCGGCAGACHGTSACHGCSGRCLGGLFSGLFNRCHGCSGSACHGRCSGSSACHGCSGSCHGGLFSRLRNRCHGCSGACTGSACHGCTGSTGGTMDKKEMPKGKTTSVETPEIVSEDAPAASGAAAVEIVNTPIVYTRTRLFRR